MVKGIDLNSNKEIQLQVSSSMLNSTEEITPLWFLAWLPETLILSSKDYLTLH